MGVVPCPAGSRLEDRGGIGHLGTIIDRVRVAAGWPRLEDADGDELRLWHFTYVSGEMIPATPPHSALRWVRGDASPARVLTWGLEVPKRTCPEMEHGGEVCSTSQPHHDSWEVVFSELNSLDVWTIDFSETSVPLPGRQSAGGVGLYIERRIDGRVERRWYGSRPGLYYGDLSHQVRAIQNALGAAVGPRRSP
ncbi:MAG: hypothetical protein GY937_04730 [bacterium]|nr:hypothetical protein [bacterium]